MEEVRRLRQEKGWNQNELAYHAKLAPSVISLIETGKREPNATTLRKLAEALEVRIPDLFEESGSGKAPRRSSPEPSLFNGPESERRESKLPRVADMLLNFGQMLLLTWEAELPARARADDDQWLQDIRQMWQQFGLINYGVTEEVSAGGLDDKGDWLSRYMARYMDLNATIHRINAAIRAHSNSDALPDELLLKPLGVA